MAFDQAVADRLRSALARRRGLTERKMFGGLVFMLHGNMVCGVMGDSVLLKLGEEGAAVVLGQPHIGEFHFAGRVSKGMIVLAPAGLETDGDLRRWVEQAVQFVHTLPPKE